jgi:hypothetical protein
VHRGGETIVKIASITVRYGRKYQISDYDWVSLEATIHAAIDEVEANDLDPFTAHQQLYAQARAAVREQARELLAQQQALVQVAQRQPLTASFPALAAAELVPAPPEPTASAPGSTPPRDATEAERRFYARYGRVIDGSTWADVRRYLDNDAPQPTTVEEWISIAEAVRDRNRPAQPTTDPQRAPTKRPMAR